MAFAAPSGRSVHRNTQHKRVPRWKEKLKDIPPEEMADIRKVFNLYDRDKDGTITTRELGPIMQLLGNNPTPAYIRRVMKEADKDGNGKLDFEEFAVLLSKYLKPEDEEAMELQEAFAVFDKDNSGTIEINEVKEILKVANEYIPDKQLREIFDDLDVDGNGKLDYKGRLKEVFSLFDKDNDGTINTTELIPIMDILGGNPTPKRMKTIMKEADKDRNGKLDFKEFTALMSKYLVTEETGAALEMSGHQQKAEFKAVKKRRDSDTQRLKTVFDMYDGNRDGTINISELMPIMQRLGNNPTRRQMKKIMRESDKDGNGTLDFEEFSTLMDKYLLDEKEAQLEILEAFRVIDKDGNGTIEFDELREVLQTAHEPISDEDLREIFDDLDANGDGMLDINEFAKIATKGLL